MAKSTVQKFEDWLELEGITDYKKEFVFCKNRKWRYDYLFKDNIAVEINDITHRIYWERIKSDCEKINEAQKLGYRVFIFDSCYTYFEQIKELIQ